MKSHKNYISVLSLVIGVSMTMPVSSKTILNKGDVIENTCDVVIPESELPKEIKDYLKKHFPDSKVLKVEKEKSGLGHKHDLKLDNGIELEFNSKNEITEIEGSIKLPDSVIPKSILKYVETNYPENGVTDWKLDKNKQEVELDNGIELEFNLNDEFLRID